MTQEVKDALKTEKDTAYFWSGLGPNGQNIAKEKAVAAGGTTLENQLEKNRIDMPEWSFNDKNPQKAWNDVSACYAENGQRYIRFDKGVESDNETNRH